VFRRYGFRYIDLLEVAKVPCRNDQFMYDDGGHPDPACARGIRRRLDQAAGLRG
jgi:hypothetical protein